MTIVNFTFLMSVTLYGLVHNVSAMPQTWLILWKRAVSENLSQSELFDNKLEWCPDDWNF